MRLQYQLIILKSPLFRELDLTYFFVQCLLNRILFEMWGELAERVFPHLKPDDFIYISGELGSYTKDVEGVQKLMYKVLLASSLCLLLSVNFFFSLGRFHSAKGGSIFLIFFAIMLHAL